MKKLTLFFILLATVFSASSKDYVITRYGIKNDSTKLNTNAIQKIIDQAAAAGGGTIVIPKGVFLSGALFFKPKTSLRLEKGAVLKGSDNIADYPLGLSRMEGQKLDYYAALINAYKVDNFSITGPGTIDGNGLKFWKTFWSHRDSVEKAKQKWTNLEVHRPRLLFIWGCNNVSIKNTALHNSGFWTTHLYQCTNVVIDGCDIRSPFSPIPAPSTDGVDIDVCKNVTVKNCYISVNDDGVAVKGGKGPNAQNLPENGIVENVLIENCSFGEVHSTLTIGSESIHAKNITMRNCKVNHKRSVLLFKMRPDTYQVFENITVENITGTCGTVVTMSPWTQFYNLNGSAEKPYGIVRNVTISNINVKCRELGSMKGNANDKVTDVLLKNITSTADKPGFNTPYQGIKIENVKVNGEPLELK